jgi:hypothetical protein
MTFVGLHEIPYFPELRKKNLCPNTKLTYRETSEKDVHFIKLAQDWIKSKAFMTIRSAISAEELANTEARTCNMFLVGWLDSAISVSDHSQKFRLY